MDQGPPLPSLLSFLGPCFANLPHGLLRNSPKAEPEFMEPKPRLQIRLGAD